MFPRSIPELPARKDRNAAPKIGWESFSPRWERRPSCWQRRKEGNAVGEVVWESRKEGNAARKVVWEQRKEGNGTRPEGPENGRNGREQFPLKREGAVTNPEGPRAVK